MQHYTQELNAVHSIVNSKDLSVAPAQPFPGRKLNEDLQDFVAAECNMEEVEMTG